MAKIQSVVWLRATLAQTYSWSCQSPWWQPCWPGRLTPQFCRRPPENYQNCPSFCRRYKSGSFFSQRCKATYISTEIAKLKTFRMFLRDERTSHHVAYYVFSYFFHRSGLRNSTEIYKLMFPRDETASQLVAYSPQPNKPTKSHCCRQGKRRCVPNMKHRMQNTNTNSTPE